MIDKEYMKGILATLKEHWVVILASVIISVALISYSIVGGGIMAIVGLIALAWLSGYRLSVGVKKEDDENHFRRPDDEDYHRQENDYDDPYQ